MMPTLLALCEFMQCFPCQVGEGMADVKEVVREAGMPHAKLWLGETSIAWG